MRFAIFGAKIEVLGAKTPKTGQKMEGKDF